MLIFTVNTVNGSHLCSLKFTVARSHMLMMKLLTIVIPSLK